jgi:hypothetical protein
VPHQYLLGALVGSGFASSVGLSQEVGGTDVVLGDPLAQLGTLRAVVWAAQAAEYLCQRGRLSDGQLQFVLLGAGAPAARAEVRGVDA